VQVRSVVLIALLAIVRTDANPRITAQAGLAHPIIGGKIRHGGASHPPSQIEFQPVWKTPTVRAGGAAWGKPGR